ncbi:MAG: chemotaxis response regulator protein-glutamate methylesterase [Spirochaetes bacterium]|nr:chemotaxis response regulator protein-glutamate methylesterase [Spirochaetota bacterium]
MAHKNKIRVIIVDDSAAVRKVLQEVLSTDSQIEVMAVASDPILAMNHMNKEWPDVIITDIAMPRKDGITFVKEIMATKPTPVIICSGLTKENARVSIDAMAAGAVEVISKPQFGVRDFLQDSSQSLIESVKTAASAVLKNLHHTDVRASAVEPKLTADALIPPLAGGHVRITTDRIVAIGASAGGTQAIEYILVELPVETPPIAIVQHMPEAFTGAFASRLNSMCQITVKEAEQGELFVPGKALIAPGNVHMMVERTGQHYKAVLKDGPLVSRHKPSVDVLFRSMAKNVGKNGLGIILTGMGDDGAAGMLEMKQAGVKTVAQDRDTSVVFGMPKMAIERGGASFVFPLNRMSSEIAAFLPNNRE